MTEKKTEKEFTLFINLREYEQGVNEDGSPALGELTDNFYCIKPENAEMTGDMMFLGYLEDNESGERVGVRLLCDPGYVNDTGEPLIVNLRLGGKYRFAHTDRAPGGIGRIRGYNLRLYESDGHEHEHENCDEHDDCGEHEDCSGDCSSCAHAH
jgi:hypothetical protein